MHPLFKKVAMIGGVETIGVVLGGVAGLLIVNVLPKETYAYYTFIIACMQLVTGMTDMGLAHSTMPIVGQRNGEVRWVVAVCARVYRLRGLLLTLGFLIVAPYWFTLSSQHGWLVPDFIAAALVVVFVVFVTMRDNFLNTILVLLGHVYMLGRISMASTVTRMLCVVAVLAIPFTSGSVAALMASNLVAGLVGLALYKRAMGTDIGLDHRLDAAETKDVDGQIKRIATPLLLSTLFFNFQGVVTIFVVSLFGTTTVLAEVGAYGRLVMLLVVLDKVANILFFPAIGRAASGKELTKKVVQGHLAYMFILGMVVLSSVAFPHYWVMLLGKQYTTIEPLLWMVFLAALFMNSSLFAFRTLAARGFTSKQSLMIPIILGTQIAYLLFFGATDLRSVVGFNLATCAAHFLFQYTLLAVRMRRGRFG